MDRREFLKVTAGVALSSSATAAQKNPEKRLPIVVSKRSGCIESLSIDGKQIQFPANGGFSAFDAAKKKLITFMDGSVSQENGKTTFSCVQKGDIKITAEFENHGNYTRISGELENLLTTERGIILNYCIPCAGPNAVFSYELNPGVQVSATEVEGSVYPLAAMCSLEQGIAMAIPPSEPRTFGMAGNSNGLTTRFYLGLYPATKNFPNRASFVFIIYPVEAEWGFRSALSKYYSFYPEYYDVRTRTDGLYMFQVKGRSPHNIDQYGFNVIETQSVHLKEDLARDEQAGITSLAYTIVGQREIKFLKNLPKDYDEAMQIYAAWSIKDHSGHTITKENEAARGDIYLREEVENSACKNSDSRYAAIIRNTPWGKNSVSWKINPSP